MANFSDFNLLFISEYTKADFEAIRYKDVDGKDVNEGFRIEIYKFSLSNFEICTDYFLMDLYLEMAAMAKRSFGIFLDFNLLANEVVNRGVQYLDIYEKGARQSFDTIIASSQLTLSEEQLNEIIAYLNKTDSEDDFLLNRFKHLLEKS